MKLHTQNIENGTVLNGLSISVFFMLYGGLFKGGCGYPGFESREQIDTNIQKPLQSRKNIFIPFSVLFYSFNYVLFGIKFGHKVASQLLHIRQIQTCWICKQFVDKYPYFEKRYYEALTIPASAECNAKNNIENIQFWFQPVKIMLLSALF